jgi:hypothetical protein
VRTAFVLVAIASRATEIPSWISADRCQICLTRTNGIAGWDIYVATRPL